VTGLVQCEALEDPMDSIIRDSDVEDFLASSWYLEGLEELWSATAGRWLLILAKCHSCGFRETPMQE